MLRENFEFNNNVNANSAFLEELSMKLPEYFTKDGEFDIEKFRNNLRKNNIEELSAGFQLDWIGKDYAKKQAGERARTVIVPDVIHNNQDKNVKSDNLFFTGDNLEVMRHLQSVYTNSIDFIYIDPPYNTGSDGFVYPDSFEYSDDQMKSMFGLTDEQLERLKSIQGRASHSAWLTFMYPRLYLAKKMLKDTGIIFVSIDDNEQANLKELMDEIFGADNFIADLIVRRKTGPNNVGNIPPVHDYLLGYAKVQGLIEDTIGLPIKTDGYINPDNDERGPWTTMPLSANHVGPYFPIKNPITGEEYLPGNGRYWVFNETEVARRIADGRIIFGKSGQTAPVQKVFLADRLAAGKKQKIGTLIEKDGLNNLATKELTKLFDGEKVFDTPKPTDLIKYLLRVINNPDALVLDFFAGSASTADAVMSLNADDGGKRQFIMATLPEPTFTINSDGSKVPTSGGETAFKAGFESIDEISRARVMKVAEKIIAEIPGYSGDLGFKHYRMVEPIEKALEEIENFSDVQTQSDLFDNMVTRFSSESFELPGGATGEQTLLTTNLIEDGYGFDTKQVTLNFSGYMANYVDESRIYLIDTGWGPNQTKELVNAIGNRRMIVQTIVLYGYSFSMESIRELEIAIGQLESKVNLQVRY